MITAMASETVLIVAAHADDEVLGCGGAIARHVADGASVHAVFLADGVNSRANQTQADLERRLCAAKVAHEILGIEKVEYLGFPDNCMDSVPLLNVVRGLEEVIQSIRPEVVYTHHHGDLNVDHRIANQAVMTACRPLPGSSVKQILSFEVPSSTDWSNPCQEPFVPNFFVNITDYFDRKLQALKAYQLEMRDPPHSRSTQHVESLARHRGSSIGLDFAEAFVSIRQIV